MKENENVFSSIMSGLKQAVDYSKGNLKGIRRRVVTIAPLPDYKAKTIRAIRNKLNLSQSLFAEALGVSIKTVEAWESGKHRPSGPAMRMLQL
jgi:putative transcriptional regulator